MNNIDNLIARYPVLASCKKEIEDSCDMITTAIKEGGSILLAGNGGSASDSDHIAGELLKGFVKKRPIDKELGDKLLGIDKEAGLYLAEKLQGSLPAIPLTQHAAVNTATLNDNAGDLIFAQQVLGFSKKENIFFGISTSGNSSNIVYAAIVAKAKGLKVITLTGKDGGKLKKFSDVCIIAPETETYKIQELHLPIYHAICLEIEERFFAI